MYKINKFGVLKTLCIRSSYLSKKFFKKNSKSTLVYLRSPKHFNIGKHKIFSFKNLHNERIELNNKLYFRLLIKFPIYFFKLLLNISANHNLKRINSLRITSVIKVKW